MEPTTELCNHTYTTLGRRVFRCDIPPHPSRPDEHYFVRDHSAVHPAARPRRNLILVPGDDRS